MNKRNPNWARDELILALDLYLDKGQLGPNSPEVIELSQLLNTLPIHTNRPDLEKFRNPNGVVLKLANFRAIDPNDPAVGMSSVGKGDKLVWLEYANNKKILKQIVSSIKLAVYSDNSLPINVEEDEDDIYEGKILYRIHRTRERNSSIVKKKKENFQHEYGKLECEICSFNFEFVYGKHGEGYIECHHIKPISLGGRKKTALSDLALVCSNCHRMLHRGNPWPTVNELKQIMHD